METSPPPVPRPGLCPLGCPCHRMSQEGGRGSPDSAGWNVRLFHIPSSPPGPAMPTSPPGLHGPSAAPCPPAQGSHMPVNWTTGAPAQLQSQRGRRERVLNQGPGGSTNRQQHWTKRDVHGALTFHKPGSKLLTPVTSTGLQGRAQAPLSRQPCECLGCEGRELSPLSQWYSRRLWTAPQTMEHHGSHCCSVPTDVRSLNDNHFPHHAD